MSTIRAAGFLIMCRKPHQQFLLMKHTDRWDLPKGHVDDKESDLECGWRELEEETGLSRSDVELDEGFEFRHDYTVVVKRFGFQPRQKTLRIYLGWVDQLPEIVPTEHPGFAWFPWAPPHQIQEQTIDPLLQAVEDYLDE